MAKRKRTKTTSRNPAKRRVSRSKASTRKSTHDNAKRKLPSRSTRKNGRRTRKVAGSAKGRKTRSTPGRKPAARVRPPRKRSTRKPPRFSDAARRSGETRDEYTRRLEYLLRAEREVTKELTRTPTERARSHRFKDVTTDTGSDIPAGFQPVGTGTGTPIGDINELTVGVDDIDWSHFDVEWDDIYDDVGDEDADLYGEDN